ncbi:MAG TPA: hypothetical protein VIP11_16255 [Gemmatimonadaceae bacterium]
MSVRSATRSRVTRVLLGVALASGTSAAGQQPTPSVAVTGAVTQPMSLTAADLSAMPRATATISSNEIVRPEGVITSVARDLLFATPDEGVWLSAADSGNDRAPAERLI